MRYCGKLGFADKVEETAPSVFTEKMTERTYYGDVLEFGRQMQMGDKVNPDITVGNQLSILADPFANDHLSRKRDSSSSIPASYTVKPESGTTMQTTGYTSSIRSIR